MMKMLDILNEEKGNNDLNQEKIDSAITLLHNARESLGDSLRYIESALETLPEGELRDSVEGFKKSLIGDFGTQFSNFNDNYDGHDRLINKLDKFIKDNSQNTDNFNLNNDEDKIAPEGDYVNGHYPGNPQ